MTDKERLLELLASYRITPTLRTVDWAGVNDAEFVELEALQGGVKGYPYLVCQFIFRPGGSFSEVGVWE